MLAVGSRPWPPPAGAAQNALRTSPLRTASTAAQTAPAARLQAPSEPGESTVSGATEASPSVGTSSKTRQIYGMS